MYGHGAAGAAWRLRAPSVDLGGRIGACRAWPQRRERTAVRTFQQRRGSSCSATAGTHATLRLPSLWQETRELTGCASRARRARRFATPLWHFHGDAGPQSALMLRFELRAVAAQFTAGCSPYCSFFRA